MSPISQQQNTNIDDIDFLNHACLPFSWCDIDHNNNNNNYFYTIISFPKHVK